MRDIWAEIAGAALMGSVFTAVTIAFAYSKKAFAGYFFGRPLWFDPRSSPIRYGIVLAFCIVIALTAWIQVIWLLLGVVIGE